MILIRKIAYDRNMKTVSESRTKMLSRYSMFSNEWARKYLDKKLSKWSIAYAPRNFFGLSITTSPLEKLNDMIKARLPTETTIPKVITKIEELAVEWQNKPVKVEKTPFTRVFGDARIDDIQQRLGSKVFYRFMKYYLRAVECSVAREDRSQDPPVYRIKLKNGDIFDDAVTKNYCPCGIRDQEGLPCEHMLTVYRHNKSLRLEDSIKDRWLMEEEPKQKREHIGRPRLSRRNVLK